MQLVAAVAAVALSVVGLEATALPSSEAAPAPRAAAPHITSLTPSSGPTVGGTAVSITGTGFSKLSRVTFGSAVAVVTASTATSVSTLAPAGSQGSVQVTVTAAGGTSQPASFLYVTVPAPGPVTSLSSVAATTSVGLAWANPADPSFAGVAIRRSTGSTPPGTPGEGVLVGDVAAPTNAFVDTSAAPGKTYAYALFTHDSAAHYSASASTTLTTLRATRAPIVTGMTPRSGPPSGGTAVTITGAGFSKGVKVDIGGTNATITSSTTTSLVVTTRAHTPGPAMVKVRTAAGANPDTVFATYTYTTPPLPDVTAPGPVTGLSAAAVSSTSVGLTWTRPGDADYAGVVIRRASGSTPPATVTDGQLVATLDASATSYTDTGLTPATGYAYAVFTRDAVPNYGAPATTTATTPPLPDVTAPGPVTGLSAAAVSSTSVGLTWTRPGDADYAGVVIRRASGSTPPATVTDGQLVATLDASATSYTDTGLTPATGYAYAVFTRDAVPNYGAPATTTATTPPLPDVTAPGPVTGLSAAAVSSTSAGLTWTRPGDADYAGVVIRRASGSTPPATVTDGQLVATLDASATSYTDTGLTPATGYAYAVFTRDAVPNYGAPATTTATTPPLPDVTAPGPVTGHAGPRSRATSVAPDLDPALV